MVDAFDMWATEVQLPNTQALRNIGESGEGPVIGIDASHYLEELRYPAKEPLVPALGGYPMTLEATVVKAVNDIESCGCKLYFFFDGLESNHSSSILSNSVKGSLSVSRAFQIYEVGDAEGAIDQFKVSGVPSMSWLCAALKIVLHKNKIPFVVAPFKAHAQMLHHYHQNVIDAMYGSTELFMYGAPKVITKISLSYEQQEISSNEKQSQKRSVFSPDQSRFSWLELDQCLKMLGDVSQEVFIDALFLVGSTQLECFPPLKDSVNSPHSLAFREVVTSLGQCGGNLFQFCERYPVDARSNWIDRYMRSYQAVKHMIVLFSHDVVKPRTYRNEQRSERAPSDLHELVGLALPEELQYYLYRGMIGPRILDWLMSGKINVQAPLAGGDSEAYTKLVKEQLEPMRKESLAILAFSINRYFQRKEITVSYWSGPENNQKFNMRDVSSPKKSIFSWRVRNDVLTEMLQEIQSQGKTMQMGSLYFAFSALKDKAFCSRTISSKPGNYEPLTTVEEIVCNVIWRFLQLRGYTDENHELTKWGHLLCTILETLKSSREQGEAAFLAVELLKLGLLTKNPLFSKEYGGAPSHGSDADRSNCLLISRLACTGKMLHPGKGYSGPLSHHLLAYHAFVTEIKSSLRDLLDMCLAAMFLEAEVDRVREDLLDIAELLPFQEHYSAGLGVLTKIYLDELSARDHPLEKADQENTMERAEGWLVHTSVTGSFRLACELWDAVCLGIQSAPPGLMRENEKGVWVEADAWLSPRRLA